MVETHSPIDAILAERGTKHVNVNLLRYISEPATLDSEAQAFLQRGMALAMEWATQGLVVPHVSQTIDGTVEAINAGLQSLKAGHGTLGKVAVLVDRALAGVTNGRLSRKASIPSTSIPNPQTSASNFDEACHGFRFSC